MKSKYEKVGYITVDAGIVQLGDPCYTSDDRNHADDWGGFCDKLIPGMKEGNGTYQVKHDNGNPGKAVVVNSGFGDGAYPVEVKRDKDGTIREVRIKFF